MLGTNSQFSILYKIWSNFKFYGGRTELHWSLVELGEEKNKN